MPGWDFRAKRLIKGMGLMSFPRYIQREARDYFYLTLRWESSRATTCPRSSTRSSKERGRGR
jgi:hypothetical protein